MAQAAGCHVPELICPIPFGDKQGISKGYQDLCVLGDYFTVFSFLRNPGYRKTTSVGCPHSYRLGFIVGHSNCGRLTFGPPLDKYIALYTKTESKKKQVWKSRHDKSLIVCSMHSDFLLLFLLVVLLAYIYKCESICVSMFLTTYLLNLYNRF